MYTCVFYIQYIKTHTIVFLVCYTTRTRFCQQVADETKTDGDGRRQMNTYRDSQPLFPGT